MAQRVTQAPVRTLITPDRNARVTQAPVRTFAIPDRDARVTQYVTRSFVIIGATPDPTAELYFKTGVADTAWTKIAP